MNCKKKQRQLSSKQTYRLLMVVGIATLTAIGTGFGELIITSGKKLFDDNQLLSINVTPSYEFYANHPQPPYPVIPYNILSPEDIPEEVLPSGKLYEYLRDYDVVDGSTQFIQLELRGKKEEPVTIRKIEVHVLERTDPVRGWFAGEAPPGCGGGLAHVVELDLDQVRPKFELMIWDSDTDTKRPGFLTVTNKDIEVIEVHAFTEKHAIQWYLEVFYYGPDSVEGSIIVKDNEGKPFKVTTELGSKGYMYTPYIGTLERYPEWDSGIVYC